MNRFKPIVASLTAVIVAIGSASAQKVPAGVTQIIETMKKDSSSYWGFYEAKRFCRLEKNLKFSDMKVGVPVEEYCFVDSFEYLPDSLPVGALIVPVGRWKIPVLVQGKYGYFVEVSSNPPPWHPISMGAGGMVGHWQEMRTAWPESLGGNPILIEHGLTRYLHFPQKGSHNLVAFGRNWAEDSQSTISSIQYATLGDSRIILRQLKKMLKTQREMYQKSLRINPNVRSQ